MLNWLLLFVPVTIALEFLMPASHTLIFIASCLAIVPLAGWLGHATEELAHHTGEGIGGLLNATFGNAAELIIAIMALREGLYPVVKASLTGSIIGNILLVLGAAVLAGGLKSQTPAVQPHRSTRPVDAADARRHRARHARRPSIRSPAPTPRSARTALSLGISVVLLAAYALTWCSRFGTHKQLFAGEEATVQRSAHAAVDLKRSVLTAGRRYLLIVWISEILVGPWRAPRRPSA